jgi:hypothetical protein
MKIKIGDKVRVSGTLTGFGDLDGYVTMIDHKYDLIGVSYTEESKQITNYIANGIVGKPWFFEKLINRPR